MRQQPLSLYGYLVRGWSLHPNITEDRAVTIPSQYLSWFPWEKSLVTIINILPYSTNALKVPVPAWVSNLENVVTLFHGSWGVLKRPRLILTFFYPHVCLRERELYVCICIHVCMPACTLWTPMCEGEHAHLCRYMWSVCVWRAKVDVRNHCQSPFHFTQWDRAHYYNYTIIIIISLLFPGSLLWGVLCLPSKAGITGGLSPSFYMSLRDQNIGPHAFTASTCTVSVCLFVNMTQRRITWAQGTSIEAFPLRD